MELLREIVRPFLDIALTMPAPSKYSKVNTNLGPFIVLR